MARIFRDIARWIARKLFPRPVQLVPRCVYVQREPTPKFRRTVSISGRYVRVSYPAGDGPGWGRGEAWADLTERHPAVAALPRNPWRSGHRYGEEWLWYARVVDVEILPESART